MMYDRLRETDVPLVVDRQARGLALDEFIDGSGIGAMLTNEADRAEFLPSLNTAQFIGLVTTFNAIVSDRVDQRDSLLPDHLHFVSEGIETAAPIYVAPAPEDKLALLTNLHTVAKSVQSTGLQAITVGHGINAIHPFTDGNGRVARAWYHLLNHDYYPGDENLQQALGEDGDNRYFLNTSIFEPPMNQFVFASNKTHVLDPFTRQYVPILPLAVSSPEGMEYDDLKRRPFNPRKERALQGILSLDPLIAESIPKLLIEGHGSRAARDAQVKMAGQPYFLIDQFLRESTEGDMRNVYSSIRGLKRQYVGELIGSLCFTRNQTRPMMTPTNERGMFSASIPEVTLLLAERVLTIDVGYYSQPTPSARG